MARAAKAIKTTKPIAPARKATRLVPAATRRQKTSTTSAAVKLATADVASTKSPKRGRMTTPVAAHSTAAMILKKAARIPATPPAPKMSKEELRAQVEKLEQLVAALRAKSRETNKAAKAAATRILELEAQVAKLEKKAATAVHAATQQPAAVKMSRAKRQGSKSYAVGIASLNVRPQEVGTPRKDADVADKDL